MQRNGYVRLTMLISQATACWLAVSSAPPASAAARIAVADCSVQVTTLGPFARGPAGSTAYIIDLSSSGRDAPPSSLSIELAVGNLGIYGNPTLSAPSLSWTRSRSGSYYAMTAFVWNGLLVDAARVEPCAKWQTVDLSDMDVYNANTFPDLPSVVASLHPVADRSLFSPPQFLFRAVPEYPERSKENGSTGTVILLATIDASGRPARIVVAKSSGHTELDEAGSEALRKSTYLPASIRGKPITSVIKVTYEFELG